METPISSKKVFFLSIEEHMKRDHNIFVSMVSFFCSISFKKSEIFYAMCYCGHCVYVAAFLHDKVYGLKKFSDLSL